MSRRFRTAALVVVVVVLAGVALSEATQVGFFQPPATVDGDRDSRAERLLNETTTAAATVDSYGLDADASVVDPADPREVSVEGVVDVDERRLRTTATAGGPVPLETYLVGTTRYRECGPIGVWWAKDELDTDHAWWRVAPLGRVLWFFEAGALRHEGTETLDGRETVVLAGSRSKRTASAVGSDADPGAVGVGTSGERVVRTDGTLRIDRETRLPRRATVELTVASSEGTATTATTWRFSGYGDEVSVDLPAEATEDPKDRCPGE